MHKADREGTLTKAAIQTIMSEEKANQRETVKIPTEKDVYKRQALIVNADVDHAAVRIGKGDDLLVNVIDHLRFIFNVFAFILHTLYLRCCLSLLYSFFHIIQYSGVKIHPAFTLWVKIIFALQHGAVLLYPNI